MAYFTFPFPPELCITKDIYDKKHQEYADKLQLLNIEIEEYTEADYEYQTTVSTVISVARRAKEIFENCSEPSEKRAFLNMILQNSTVNGKELCFSIVSPFDLVLELADSPNWLPILDKFRTLNWQKIKKDIESFEIFQVNRDLLLQS